MSSDVSDVSDVELQLAHVVPKSDHTKTRTKPQQNKIKTKTNKQKNVKQVATQVATLCLKNKM